MKMYLFRRLISLIPVLLVVGTISFLIIHLTPGDPAAVILGPEATPEEIMQLRSELGLDQPLHIQFVNWVQRIFVGDFGNSLYFGVPVVSLIMARLEPTLVLALYALVIAMILGVFSGIYAATKRGQVADTSVMAFTLVGMSAPSFWLALNFIILFSLRLGWFPVAGYSALSDGLTSTLLYMTLPSLALGINQAALISRITRTSMIEILQEDYVRTARAKGLKEHIVTYKHALKNSLIPIVTTVGTIFATLMAGALVIEMVFGLPGVGRLVVTSIARRDYPVVQGAMIFIALAYVLINLLIDVIYTLIDPRIKYQD